MPKAFRLPSGNYRCRVYNKSDETGKRVCHSVTAPTRKQAELEAALLAFKLKQPQPDMTLGRGIDRYIEVKQALLSPATVHGYKSLRRNAFPGIIDLPLSSLTREMQQKAINDYAASHTPKTVRNAAGLLSAVLNMFCEDRACRLTLPQPKKKRITIPTKAQIDTLIAAVKDTEMEIVILLASSIGLRRSEIAALMETDFDFDACTVHIRRAMVQDDDYIWRIKPPKSEAGDRVLSVPQSVIDRIKEMPANDTGYLIGLRPDIIGDRFYRLKNRIGINCRLHDLRHYYASILHALNVPDLYAMKRTGHSTPDMLKKVYQHIMDNKDDEVDTNIKAKMNELFL